MKELLDSPSAPGSREEAASHWLMRLQGDTATDADIAEWLRWCSVDPRNLESFDDTQRLYDRLRGLASQDREQFLQLTHITPSITWARNTERFMSLVNKGPRRVVASSVAGLLGLTFMMWLLLRPTSLDVHDYTASRGNPHALTLADHSRIILGDESELKSQFTTQVRLVELRKGEAFFEIQHDRARPFVVTTNGVTVTAVGTKFNVRRTQSRIVVVVAEGAVDISTNDPTSWSQNVNGPARDPSPSTPVRVRTGQQAVRDTGHRGLTVSDIDPTVATAWREGRLAYIMEPLSSVIEDVNRYTSRPIIVTDPKVNEMTFTGTIFRDHIDDWAMTLASAFPIAVEATPNGTITLSMRSDSH